MPLFDLGQGRTVEVDEVDVFPEMEIGHRYEPNGEGMVKHTSYSRFLGEKLVIRCISHEPLQPEALAKRQERWQLALAVGRDGATADILSGRRTAQEITEKRSRRMEAWEPLEPMGEAASRGLQKHENR